MQLTKEIEQFLPITLEEMEKVKLMNRTDVKFIFNVKILPELLEKVKDDYYILVAAETRVASYQTLYFDTAKNKFYLHHHNGKRNRFKVRYRKYIESELTFFEIKYKNNKGRVIKTRIKVDEIQQSLGEEELRMVKKKIRKKINLEPRLENKFNRITLVAKQGVERLTLDFNLSFTYNNEIDGFQTLAIAEVKQERYSRDSKIMEVLRQFGVRPARMSKYAIGMSIFSDEKANSFKEKRLRIDKIIHDDI